MHFLRELSFPHRILALIIALIVIGGGVYLGATYVRGTITIQSPQSDATVEMVKSEESATLPQTFRLRPGRYVFYVAAPGYLSRHVRLPVYAFLHKVHTVVLFRDVTTNQEKYRITYDSERDTIIIVPKIDFTALESPKDQVAKQWSVYEKNANEALAYIRARGVDPRKLTIEWWGHEWWPKGKKVKVE